MTWCKMSIKGFVVFQVDMNISHIGTIDKVLVLFFSCSVDCCPHLVYCFGKKTFKSQFLHKTFRFDEQNICLPMYITCPNDQNAILQFYFANQP